MSKNDRIQTTIRIERELWKRWLRFCVTKEGSTRHSSKLVAKALEEYIAANKHKTRGVSGAHE